MPRIKDDTDNLRHVARRMVEELKRAGPHGAVIISRNAGNQYGIRAYQSLPDALKDEE